MMRVALFIPCYVNQFYPEVAISTLQLLEKFGCSVVYPLQQTCCGQPMANAGFEKVAKNCNQLFIDNFKGYDYIVCPSGSCTLHIKEHLTSVADEAAAVSVSEHIFELTEFLTDVLKVEHLDASFPYRVGVHQSCHGQRGLHTSQMTELVAAPFSKMDHLLQKVAGLQLVTLDRKDECCGFGGTFCVTEEAVSAKMGKDRVADHEKNNVEVITSGDMSCLMHLQGILKRKNSSIQIKHVAEILNAAL
jgi:L-lactate dehydrogenase complex protein LldE